MYNLGTLIKYEYKKLFQRKAVWILTFTLMALAALSVILPPFTSAVSSNTGASYTAYDSCKTQRELASDLSGRSIDSKMLKEMNAVLLLDYNASLPAEERKPVSGEIISALPDDLRLRLSGKTENIQPEDLTASPASAVPYSVKYDDIDYFVDDCGAAYLAEKNNSEQTGMIYLYTCSTDDLYQLRRDTNEKIWDIFYLSDQEKTYLSKQEAKLSTPFTYQYCSIYKSILSCTVIAVVMISFLTVVCIPPVSADEHSRRTDQIILCTRLGKRTAFFAKLFTAVTFSVCAVLLIYASIALPSFFMYGTEGFSAQIQAALPGCTWDLSVGQASCILIGICAAAAVLLSCTALFLAECFKTSIPVMGILIGFLLISSFLNIPEQFRILSQIWSYCPAKLISVSGSMLDPRLIPFFGTYLASYQAGPFIYLILALLFSFGGFFVWKRWQAGGR